MSDGNLTQSSGKIGRTTQVDALVIGAGFRAWASTASRSTPPMAI